MGLWATIASIFLPQFRGLPAAQSRFEGLPDQARHERPLPARAITRWTQADVERAIAMADQGKLAHAARLAAALRRDGAFSGLLSTRAGGLTRLPRIFRGTPGVVADLEASDDEGLFDRVYPPKELELLDADGIILGVGVGEHVPVPGRDEPIFVRLEPEFLDYRWSEDRWYYQSSAGLLPITPGDGRWVLHTPGGYMQPWRSGLWPSLGRAYVAKEHAYLYRENYSGKLANPALLAFSPSAAPDESRWEFVKSLIRWGMNTIIGIPPGWDVKVLEAAGRGYEVFQQTIENADKEFMVGLAGQIVTVTGGAGFSNADIHATIRSDLIQGDGQGLAATINAQGLRPLIDRLYGCSARGLVAWDTRPPVDLVAEANAISAAAAAIKDGNDAFRDYGTRVQAAEIATRFKIPTFPIEVASARDEAEGGPSADAAARLAEKMTQFGLAKCEHGASNRCRLCGIERERDFDVDANGAQTWRILWRPIPAAPAPRPDLRLLQGGAS